MGSSSSIFGARQYLKRRNSLYEAMQKLNQSKHSFHLLGQQKDRHQSQTVTFSCYFHDIFLIHLYFATDIFLINLRLQNIIIQQLENLCKLVKDFLKSPLYHVCIINLLIPTPIIDVISFQLIVWDSPGLVSFCFTKLLENPQSRIFCS